MKSIGAFAIYFALYASFVGIALSIVAGRTGSRRFIQASQFSAYTVFGALAIASSALLHALLTHDFSIQYVAAFTDRTMPIFYLLGSFWGGQAGSLLFWVTKVSLFTVLCIYVNRNSFQNFMPWVTAVCLTVTVGLLIILAFGSNPFEAYTIIDDPTNGKGLNPLLQTPKMVLHPPALLTGMATMTIPFAFAIAALITGNLSNTWVEAARKWILLPWLFLSIGNILGGMWAYEELGWGGYWAWDPVENSSFLPWLTSTALIHSLMIQERRNMLKRWNIGLMIGTFALTIFGTYITRSGLIESIHSFAQSDIGPYFLVLLLTVTIGSTAMFLWRWKALKSPQRLDSPISREATFIFNNWMFLTMTLVVMFGTLWPKIREALTGQEIAMGPQWFNRWMIPMGIVLLLLMGVGTIIAWRRANWKNFRANFIIPIASMFILTPLTIGIYWFMRGADLGVNPDRLVTGYAISAVALIIFSGAATLQEFLRGISARRRGRGESLVIAFINLCLKQKRRYGGYLVHVGILFMFLAFTGNALKIEKDVSLMRGESIKIGDYTLTYNGLRERNDREKTLIIADVPVERNGKKIYYLHPGKAIFHASPQMPTSEIDIRSTPFEDLYVALVNHDQNGSVAAFKVFIAPFTWWFWLGGVVLVLGTLICLWPTRESVASLRFSAVGLARVGLFFGMIALCFIPLMVWTYESISPWGSALRYDYITVQSNALPLDDAKVFDTTDS